MASQFDTRLLSWGGFLSVNDLKSNKENRWILTININSSEILVIQHEQQHAKYPFSAVLCCFANLKYENAVMIFWKNAKPPLQFFFDSASDRDSVQQILESIPKQTAKQTAITVGCSTEFATLCEKKGKMKWAQRYIQLVKSRILIFRDNNHKTSLFPLQMISLLEPNIQIQISQQYPKTVDIYAQEKHFYFKLSSPAQVKEFVDRMSKTRERMTHEANAFAKLQMLKLSESKRNMMQKSMVARQDYVSRREISSRRFNPNNVDSTKSVHKIMLANGSSLSFKGLDAASMTDLGSGGLNLKRKGKQIKFDKAFKPQKHKSDIFMWGKARPPRLFPKHTSSAIPFRHDDLSKKRFVLITCSKDGTHCMGMTDNDWSFVWGEANFTGALGLGSKVNSTLPYLLKSLRKQNIIQITCSSRHGLAVTVTNKVYGWGAKQLTNLDFDTQEPQILPFLDNLGILAIDCCNTHSVAYSSINTDVYQFGLKGPWLGLQDASKTFGKVKFDFINQNNNSSKPIAISKVSVASQYSLYLLSNGYVYTTGVNEHGRMGCGKEISQSQQPIKVQLTDSIGEISAASFHSGYISFKNKLFTCGVGADYRLGHENESTVYIPSYVENLSQVKCARVECVQDRTFIITKYGAVLMFGVEPVSGIKYRKPFVFEFLRTHRIYQVCGAKDFTVALGVQAKEQVLQPNVESDHNAQVDMKMGDNYNQYSSTAANTINQRNVIGNGQRINTVIGGNFAQSSGPSQPTGPPPMVPLDANPGFNNMAKPLPDVVPVSNPYSNSLPQQLPNPYAMNNGFGPPPSFGGGGPPSFGGPPPLPQHGFGGPPPPPQQGAGPPPPPQQNKFGGGASRPPPPSNWR